LLISVPFLNTARKKAYEGLDSIGSGEFYQYLFEEEEFKRKLENVGFKIEKIYKLNWIKGYKEIKNFQNKNQSLQTNKVAKTNKKVINKHFSRDNFIKALVKKSVIRFSNFSFLTKYYGHMILFVAKKV